MDREDIVRLCVFGFICAISGGVLLFVSYFPPPDVSTKRSVVDGCEVLLSIGIIGFMWIAWDLPNA